MAEKEGSGIARSSPHAVHVLPHAPHAIARFLGPALERLSADVPGTQLLIVTPDTDTTLAVAEVARSIDDRSAAAVVPLTGTSRSARLMTSRAPLAVAATAGTLVSLLRQSSIKLEDVRTVVIAWADEIFTARQDEPLEILLAEIPKDAIRTVVAERMTPEVEALVERHLRRAQRHGVPDAESFARIALKYVVTSPAARGVALRRVLDELDPPSVLIVTADERGVAEVRETLRVLGYPDDDPNVRIARVGDEVEGVASLVVLFDLPTTAAELTRVAAVEAPNVVALAAPRQLPGLRRLTTGAVEPLDVSATAARARSGEERVRAALRTELEASFPAREVMALEPLLQQYDGLEIAAAALRLLERERAEARARITDAERVAAALPPARAAEEGFARVFITIGERDGVRPGDLVGAISNEAGITSDRIGRIDLRETHTVAEIATSVVEQVLEKINGITLRGRRITARIDDRPPPPPREGREGPREGRGRPRPGARGGAADRREGGRPGPREEGRERGGARDGGFRSGRGGPRDRPRDGGRDGGGFREAGRESRFPRDDRPPRRGPRDGADRPPRPRHRDDDAPRGRGGFRDRDDQGRVPRAAREREEWEERADRVRNARRPRRDEM